MFSCPTEMPYDLTLVARSYGAFAGILAGFAFAAVVQTLTRPSGKNSADAHAVVALLSAFFGFLLAALLYAILNGESHAAVVEGRAATEQVMAAVVLGFAALTLLYGVVVMIDSRNLSSAAEGARFMVGVLIPPLVTLQVALAGGDSYIADLVSAGINGRACSRAAYDSFSVWGVYVPSTIVLALSLAAWLLRRRISAPNSSRLRDAVPYLSLTLALIATVAFSFIPPLNTAYQLPSWALHLLIWSTALFATLISILTVAQPESSTDLACEEDPSTDPTSPGDSTTAPT